LTSFGRGEKPVVGKKGGKRGGGRSPKTCSKEFPREGKVSGEGKEVRKSLPGEEKYFISPVIGKEGPVPVGAGGKTPHTERKLIISVGGRVDNGFGRRKEKKKEGPCRRL